MPSTPSRVPRPLTSCLAGYGVLASVAVLAVALVRDGSALTYAAGLFAFWWLVPALPLVPLAVAARWWRSLATLLVPAVTAGALLAPTLLHRVDPPDAGPADLRVADFNSSGHLGTAGLEGLLDEWAPDVVLLQEITPGQRAGLDGEHPEYPYRSYTATTAPAAGEEGDGDAVWSRFPILAVTPVTGLPRGARPADVVTLDVDGRPLAVVSVHLASPCLLCSRARQRLNPAGGPARAARVRIAEARRFAEVVRDLRARGSAVVLGGDLNSAELNEPLGILTGGDLVDVHRAVGTRPQLTRGSNPGFARVDVVLVAGLDPVADAEGSAGGSTHAPVVADLAWPAGDPAPHRAHA